MNRHQLAHLLRSACAITQDEDVLVLGSQSILGSYDEDDLPPEATASQEADLAFLDDPERFKADQVEAIIGEMSAFHDANGVYAEGIHVTTAVLPDGWRDRLVGWDLQSSRPAKPHFLEPHDLAVAKLAASRDKDRAFVAALIKSGMLDVPTIRQRAYLLPTNVDSRVHDAVHGWLDYYDNGKGRLAAPKDKAASPSGRPTRGRTTPDSTAGSFAPRQRDEATGVELTDN